MPFSAVGGETSVVAVFGTNNGFATLAANHTLEAGWESAVDAVSARLALAGDTLDLNAEDYATTEGGVVDAFTYGLGG